MSEPTAAPRTEESAVLGGGCFWCTEAVFDGLAGVVGVEPGYAGGHVPRPTYEQVCTGTTGHAEVVRVRFDARALPYRELLGIFFATHDPTTRDRQGHDVGPQYRSVILYRGDAQRADAEAVRAEVARELGPRHPVVTEIAALTEFYPAEEYHRAYFRRNPEQAYCRAVIAPKLAKFRARYADRLRSPASAGDPPTFR